LDWRRCPQHSGGSGYFELLLGRFQALLEASDLPVLLRHRLLGAVLDLFGLRCQPLLAELVSLRLGASFMPEGGDASPRRRDRSGV